MITDISGSASSSPAVETKRRSPPASIVRSPITAILSPARPRGGRILLPPTMAAFAGLADARRAVAPGEAGALTAAGNVFPAAVPATYHGYTALITARWGVSRGASWRK